MESTNKIQDIQQDRKKGLSNFRKIISEPLGLLGFILVLIMFLLAIFSSRIAPYDPNSIDILNKLSGPSVQHWFGTDHLGRDLLSRLIFGVRLALMVALPSIMIGLLFGIILGVISGYSSGFLSDFIVIIVDIIKSFPSIIFAITIMAFTGPSIFILILVLGVTGFPAYARVIRAQTLKVAEKEYILAAKAIGVPQFKIMLKHILPNVIGPVFIQASMDVPTVITFIAALSFLGLGAPPPTPSWGAILRNGYLYIHNSPWMIVFGGLFLILATIGFTFFSEALRDVLDPKLGKDKGET